MKSRLLIAFLSVIFFFTACSQIEKEKINYQAALTPLETFSAIPYWNFPTGEDEEFIEYKNENAPTSRKFLFAGKEYDLSYETTFKQPNCSYEVDTYNFGPDANVYFREDIDQLSLLSIPDGNWIKTEQALSETNYRMFAEEILKEYLDPAEYRYTCTTSYFLSYESGGGDSCVSDGFLTRDSLQNIENLNYNFHYTRYIGDLKTYEIASVSLSENGSLERILIRMQNEFQEFQNLKADVDSIKESVNETLRSSLKDETVTYEGCTVEEIVLHKDADGNPYFKVSVAPILWDKKTGKPIEMLTKINLEVRES